MDNYISGQWSVVSGVIKPVNFQYSDKDFNILSGVISAVSVKKYEKFIYDNTLKLASMEKVTI